MRGFKRLVQALSLACGLLSDVLWVGASGGLLATGCAQRTRRPTITHPPTRTREHLSAADIDFIEATYWANVRGTVDAVDAALGDQIATEIADNRTADAHESFDATRRCVAETVEAFREELWYELIDADEALAHSGEYVCVVFEVKHTRSFGAQVFLNSRYPCEGHFYLYVHESNWHCWTRPPEELFLNKLVIACGTIQEHYAGWPQIVLGDCQDIRILW